MTNETESSAPRSFFKRLRAKLNQGPAWLTTDIAELLPGRKIDAEILDELETRLITADVGIEASSRILEDLRRRVARKELNDVDALLKALHDAMSQILKPVERALVVDPTQKPFVILVVGINGAGKTTTIGKLAHRLLGEGRSVMLAAGDTFRAAAREQLEVWAARNNVPIVAQQSGAEPAAVIFDAMNAARARGIDVLIADTAGRLHTQTHLMDELKKVKRVLGRLDACRRTPRSAVGARRHHRPECGCAGAGISQGLGSDRPRHHQARRYCQGRRCTGDRSETQNSHPLHRRRRTIRGFRRLQRVRIRVCPSEIRTPRRRRMIRFDQVHKRYPNGREALSNVSFNIEAGALTFLTGHSGAGKSSILKLIALIERPTRGQVIVNSQNTARVKARGIPQFRRNLGVVFQDHKLLHDRPVADNVALPLVIAGISRREIDKRVRAALDQVGLLGKEKSRPLELSSGEQQRVGIARAVVAKPTLLIADEPTGNLDPELALEVMKLFKRFSEVGVTVVIASHDVHLIDQLGARRILLSEGRVASDPEARTAP
jgi:cell division transport system ATP-binding protein